MRQSDLVAAFLAGETSGEAKSLSIDSEQLIHYNTAIAERYDGKIILNYTRYSLATGKVQKMLTDAVDPSLLVYVSAVPSDTRTTLVDYLPDGYGDSVARSTICCASATGSLGRAMYSPSQMAS